MGSKLKNCFIAVVFLNFVLKTPSSITDSSAANTFECAPIIWCKSVVPDLGSPTINISLSSLSD